MPSISQARKEPLSPGMMLKSDSGQTYKVEEVLADQRKPLLCVYRASSEGKNYIMKNMIQGEFEYQLKLQKALSTCPNVRAVVDTIQELEVFIYPFLSRDLLHLSQRKLSKATRRYILRCALRGIADMHHMNVLHNGKYIKPNNILVDYEESPGVGMIIKNVQISDLEDTVIVPPGKWLTGPLCGNAIWRSTESWCRSRQNQASDVFSFGIMMIYVMVNEMVFRVRDDELNSANSWRHILCRHISYFADEDGLNGLLGHIGEENPFYERLLDLANSFGHGNPRQPFQHWSYVEPELRDLVGKMTHLDPTKRITAREALQHQWFSETVTGDL
ncbi:hypothetical protein ARAM_003249 [Aspergillus rambellii]|uniref:Protein kinase domain-containing protein n=1 Tax=Aspergillus rambellii TaxID=308745 RepID=A0A0F8XF68_9EURO|nr:hypothetical protein ARAM_003249 [Aspergillus rambellii]